MNRTYARSARGPHSLAVRRAATHRGLCVLALVAALIGHVSCAAQDASEHPAVVAAPVSADIARWIRELDDSHFVTRRNATERLIETGYPAIEPLMKALAASNLEVATRGIYVLKALALSKDVPTQNAAADALQELTRLPARGAARQAATTLAALGEVRQQQALSELQDLGAQISMNERIMAFAPVVGLSVVIGPNWQGQVDDLQRFRWLVDVQEVSFIGRQFTDEWIRSVAYLPSVERVLVKHAAISNEAVKSISQLKRVTKVDLMYTPISDQALDYLREMKSLRELRLYGTDITADAVAQYRVAATPVTIDFKKGAFLGVMCQQPPLPCQVIEVVPNSAAAAGGVKVDDVIVRYGGEPIRHFDDLRNLISKNKVGDSVLIQVARGGIRINAVLPQKGGLALGVAGDATTFGCKVTQLDPAGAVAKAGVRVNDVITDLNELPVANLEELSQLFAALPAEMQLEFSLVRNSQTVSRRVTFGEWTEATR